METTSSSLIGQRAGGRLLPVHLGGCQEPLRPAGGAACAAAAASQVAWQYNAVRNTFSLNFALIFSLTGARRQNAKLVAFGVVTARHGAQVSPQPHYQQQQQQQQLQQYPGYGQQQQQVPWYVGDTGGGRQQGQGMPTILVQEPDQEEDPTRF